VYRYDQIDQTLVNERVSQFRDQTRRFLAGELSEDEFRPLRLRNGLYIQRHAPMLRVSIPYGLLSSAQLHMLAHIARTYDRDYGHFTTRQNIQFNWPQLERVPDILADLASVQMHAIQTSGNCIRNITADHLAGVAPDEITDPRPYCEIIRQWAALHPEFSYLPRKFKIAVTAAEKDRAAIRSYDIGLHLRRSREGELSFEVLVGGGQGRTPYLAKTVREHLPAQHLNSRSRMNPRSVARQYDRRGSRVCAQSAQLVDRPAARRRAGRLPAPRKPRRCDRAMIQTRRAPGFCSFRVGYRSCDRYRNRLGAECHKTARILIH